MFRSLVAAFALLTSFAVATHAGAREYRFFDGGDRVYHQRFDHVFEPISEPRVHLLRAERSFAKGHRFAAADNLEKAAAGFGYFSERAAGMDRKQLELTRRALDKLARQVRRGDVEELNTLQQALSDARRVLAGEAVMTASAPRES